MQRLSGGIESSGSVMSNETYDEFLGRVAERHSTQDYSVNWWRYGQTYYNLLPREIADVLVGTKHDPFYYDFVTEACHDRVRRIWDRR